MYKADDLKKYEYFQDFSLEYIIDPLTGVVSRGYIMEFAKSLIDSNTPFAFVIMDIDNFKLVNDYYGHSTGDECLRELASSLVVEVGDKGVVGRYGGDEFVIIYLGDNSYDGMKAFLTTLYGGNKVVRRTMCLSNVHIFITATIGSASFPSDATEFEDLFTKCDKALYRGKTKGRNCYIIYVDEKHKNIDPHKHEAVSIPEIMTRINQICRSKIDVNNRVADIISYLKKSFGLADALVMFNDSTVISTLDRIPHTINRFVASDIEKCFVDSQNEIIATTNVSDIKTMGSGFARFLSRRNDQSVIITPVSILDEKFGYIVFLENKIQRIWQEKEIAMALYAAKALAVLAKEYKN